MRILYLHQHFALPSGSTGTRSYEFAKRWVKAGHQVTIICGHYDIGGLEYTKEPQIVDGIKILIAGTKYSNKMNFFKRVFSFISFIFSAFLTGLKQKDITIIYATSTPLTIGIPAVLLKWFRKIPFVFEVRDQWPEIPIEMGIIRSRILIKVLLWLEKTIYKNAAAIVALSPGMAQGIKTVLGIIPKPVTVIPNCCDTDLFNSDVDSSSIRKEKSWEDKFVLLHTGAMGKANGLEFVIDAAKNLQNLTGIHFVLIGDGRQKQMLIDRIKDLGLRNIEILDSVPKKEISSYMAACDVSMIIFANYPILEHNSANKFFDSLSAGKPVLLNYSGWQRRILEENNAGFGIQLCEAEEFAQKVIFLYNNRQLAVEMGHNGRRIALTQFDHTLLARQTLDVIENAFSTKQ